MSDAEVLSYILELGESRFAAREVAGEEALSRPFRFELAFRLAPTLELDPDRWVRATASIAIERRGEVVRRIEGIVTEMWCVAAGRGEPEAHVVLEPRLVLARHRVDMRVFRDRTVPEIAADVLGPLGVEIELRLAGAYEKLPYCVELRESDLDFVSRLLESEGIAYFFLEGRMVLADAPSAWEALAEPRALPFRPSGGLSHDLDAVVEIAQRARVTAGKVSLRDYDPEHPGLDMDVEAAGPTPMGPELYDYPGEYALPQQGARKARRIAEELAASHAGLVGRTPSGRLYPGCRFDFTDAPAPVPEGAVAVTSLAHRWRATEGGSSVRFEAISAALPFRPARVTPAPRLVNPLTGVVTGPKDADVHTDALGRVKVRMSWDRRSPLDDSCSDWIPVVQDNTGHSCGVPRVGWEVLVHFLEGDPDRPVVLGRLYNGMDPFPEALPQNKTMSSLESRTSPGRSGSNRIRMNDAAGAEEVYVQAERDQEIAVANDKRIDVGREETRHVEGSQSIAIGGSQTTLVGADASIDVTGAEDVRVAGSRAVSVAKDDQVVVGGDHTLAVGGSLLRRIKTDDGVEAKALDEKVGAVILEASLGESSTTSKKGTAVLVGGAIVEVARKDKAESTRLARAEAVGGLVVSKSGAATSVTAVKNRTTTIGGGLVVDAMGAIEIGASSVYVSVGGAGRFTAGSLSLEVGGSKVVLADGVLFIKSASVTVEADAAAELHQDGAKLW